jgi:flagellar biosynthetic protein FlhB
MKEDMAEERFESRSEPASSKRLAEARARGEVPRSAELVSLAMLLAFAGTLSFAGDQLFQGLASMLAKGMQGAASYSLKQAFDMVSDIGPRAFALLAAAFLAALISPLLLSGWVFAPQIMAANPVRLNPFLSLRRFFSLNGFFGGIKGLLALALLSFAAWHYLSRNGTELFVIWRTGVPESLSAMASWLGHGLLLMAAAVAFVALLDSVWQWWRYLSGLAMTRSEALAEAQEEEMSASVRARMASAREETGRRAAE